MRARIVAEMRAHPERYVAFAEQWDVPGSGEARHGNSWAEFVSAMEVEGEWGGNTTLLAAANAYGRVLHVVSAPASTTATRSYYTALAPVVTAAGSEGEDIWLAYLNGDHYRATALLDGYASVHDIQCPLEDPRFPLSHEIASLSDRFQQTNSGGFSQVRRSEQDAGRTASAEGAAALADCQPATLSGAKTRCRSRSRCCHRSECGADSDHPR